MSSTVASAFRRSLTVIAAADRAGNRKDGSAQP